MHTVPADRVRLGSPAMSSSIAPLEAHLKARPDDASSWLVYADYLAEQGDARGELIRLEHLQADPRRPAEERASLSQQIAALIKTHRPAWQALVPSPTQAEDEAAAPRVRIQWRHGFVVGLELDWVERLAPALEAFLASPESRLLGTLAISHFGVFDEGEDDDLDEDDFDEEGRPRPSVDAEEVEAALEGVLALDLSRLHTLSFAYLGMQAAGAKVLAKAEGLTQLVQLDLRYNDLGNAGVKALCNASFLPQLEALHLQANGIGAAGVKLLTSLDLPKLKVLDLRRNGLKTAGARALAESKLLSRLTTLGLHREDLGTAGVKALAKSPTATPRLRTLWKALAAVKPTAAAREDD